MKKSYLFLATAALLAASCSSDEFMGDKEQLEASKLAPISFDGGTGVITRAAQTGATAAGTLGNSFVVYGWKTTKSPAATQKVYDHYTVNYKDGSRNSTKSNTAGWEYVGQTLNDLTSLDKANGAEQDIKYWDFAADQYDFIAFSIGEQASANKLTQVTTAPTADNQVQISQVTTTNGPTYKITGKLADIAKVYIADRVTATKSPATKVDNRLVGYKDAVQFNFHSAVAKVRMGIYETIPGYSVKDVKFYNAAGTESMDASDKPVPTLYSTAATAPIANATGVVTATVTFPETNSAKKDYNKAVLTLPDAAKSKDMTFGDIALRAAEHKEDNTSSVYLGRNSVVGNDKMNVSICEYVNVFPCTPGALTLKVDYTLVARDGSGETIKVTGATATVPAEYGNWQPNYAYTYIFKISDNTNGSTGGGEAGLYPITFDAIVTADETGKQETITTIATPSITTYAKGAVADEYCGGDNIYVSVNGVTVTADNLKLYKVTTTGTPVDPITEESVKNALEHSGVLDIAGGKLTVTAVTSGTDAMTIADAIAAADAPDGNAVTLANKAGKFKATASTTYAVEYNAGGSPAVKHYKVIRVGATSRQ